MNEIALTEKELLEALRTYADKRGLKPGQIDANWMFNDGRLFAIVVRVKEEQTENA